MGTDARVRYTKMVIQKSFLSLLKGKPIKRITVKEICELAQINRATFYKHYADAYDLMDNLEQEILQELQSIMAGFPSNDVRGTLIRILEKMKENGNIYITLFSGNGDMEFPMKIFKLCYSEISEDINRRFPHLSPAQRAWMYVYLAQGCSGILNCWISDGMIEPADTVADFLEKLISSTVRNVRDSWEEVSK